MSVECQHFLQHGNRPDLVTDFDFDFEYIDLDLDQLFAWTCTMVRF